MVEEKVEIEVLPLDFEVILAPHKGETDSDLDQEFPDVLDQSALQLPLVGVFGERQEIENVGVFERLLREV